MSMKWKVYGWQGIAQGNRCVRMICCAPSKSRAAKFAGYEAPRQMFNLCETGNEDEIRFAMASPGVVLWAPMDGPDRRNYRPMGGGGDS